MSTKLYTMFVYNKHVFVVTNNRMIYSQLLFMYHLYMSRPCIYVI